MAHAATFCHSHILPEHRSKHSMHHALLPDAIMSQGVRSLLPTSVMALNSLYVSSNTFQGLLNHLGLLSYMSALNRIKVCLLIAFDLFILSEMILNIP